MSFLISCLCLLIAPTWGRGVQISLCPDEEGIWKPLSGRERQIGPLSQRDWSKLKGWQLMPGWQGEGGEALSGMDGQSGDSGVARMCTG